MNTAVTAPVAPTAALELECAYRAGDPLKARQWMQRRDKLITERSPEQVARMEAAIERTL